ncbi:macrofage activating glycoprotein [Ephemerocybe angulata]|uniref:Macrofage activating glycoprotein n=1 Tax=Ephemerocybe angulata TaxID=980116 RepID=A0A8H6I152_9AGAR|nr:macrofage activating glycoprotein [Tulosesus angulatus]
MPSIFATLSSIVLLSVLVHAQGTPEFLGELLLRPSVNDAKCLTVQSNSDGAVVVLQTCTGSANQKWTFTGGNVRAFGNKCLDVKDGVNQDGSRLQVWTCASENTNQKWNYNKWDNTLEWQGKGKCVDLVDGKQDDGTPTQIWSCWNQNSNQIWTTGYMYNALPDKSQNEQYGTNNCGTGSDSSSNCQTGWLNSASDFCLWAPPTPGTVGDMERVSVAWCTKSGRGARTIPNQTLKGVHFVQTPDYVQITGQGDFTKMNIPKGDYGGELDNRGADGKGNPIGGLLFGDTFTKGQQYNEWTEFISDSEFCIRACRGPKAKSLCNHIYDVMGCYWNMPANYNSGVFEECVGDDAQPMGVYGTSTWYQGVNPTPSAHPAPASSNCKTLPTVSVSPVLARRGKNGNRTFDRDFHVAAGPQITPPPAMY